MTKKVTIPSSRKLIYKQYLTITKPLNGLRPKEIDVLSLLLYYNYKEQDNFKRDEDRWKRVFSYETKMKIKEELEIKDYTLQNILSSLRKKKAIINNQITNYFIPKIEDDTFKLVFEFNLSNE
jgi:hypothetical protein